MTEPIEVLRAEIETEIGAALKSARHYYNLARRAQGRADYSKVLQHTACYAETQAFIRGLQTAVDLLEKQRA